MSKVMEKLRAKAQYQLAVCYLGFSGLATLIKIVNRLLQTNKLQLIFIVMFGFQPTEIIDF